jgi:hypothetical protein
MGILGDLKAAVKMSPIFVEWINVENNREKNQPAT